MKRNPSEKKRNKIENNDIKTKYREITAIGKTRNGIIGTRTVMKTFPVAIESFVISRRRSAYFLFSCPFPVSTGWASQLFQLRYDSTFVVSLKLRCIISYLWWLICAISSFRYFAAT